MRACVIFLESSWTTQVHDLAVVAAICRGAGLCALCAGVEALEFKVPESRSKVGEGVEEEALLGEPAVALSEAAGAPGMAAGTREDPWVSASPGGTLVTRSSEWALLDEPAVAPSPGSSGAG